MVPRFCPLLVSALWLAVSLPCTSARADLQPEVLATFASGVTDFSNGVILAPDGNYYGLSNTGGAFGCGTFFQVTPSGTVSILASFGDPSTNLGKFPSGRLVYDGSQYFYGATQHGGPANAGTIFRATMAGSLETLVTFTDKEGAAPGSDMDNALTLGTDGNFYGVTGSGGAADSGVLFRLSPQGRYEPLLQLTDHTGAAPGDNSESELLLMPDGSFLGTAREGGKANAGLIFQYTPGGAYVVLAQFTGAAGAFPGTSPSGPLLRATDGSVYGSYQSADFQETRLWRMQPGGKPLPFVSVTLDNSGKAVRYVADGFALLPAGDLVGLGYLEAYGAGNGSYDVGVGLFRITPAGVITPYVDLTLLPSGKGFGSGLIADGSGGLAGVLGDTLFQVSAGGVASVLTRTDADAGSGTGTAPDDVLLINASDIYGRASLGGANHFGTIFRVPSTGSLTAVRDLPDRGAAGPAYNPPAALGSDILLPEANSGASFNGAIERITPAGSASEYATFSFPDLFYPQGGLIAGDSTNLYGQATRAVQVSPGIFQNQPVVYRLNSVGGQEFVAALVPPSATNNVFINGPLTWDGVGNLLAVTFPNQAGVSSIYQTSTAGVVSKRADFGGSLNPTGTLYPQSPLLVEPSGSVLVAMESDTDEQNGALVRIPPTGPPQKAVQFTGTTGVVSGAIPRAPIVRDASGRSFGVTLAGGASDLGVLYRLDANGTYNVLHEFRVGNSAADDGYLPKAGLTAGAGGYLYGTTSSGGPGGGGTVFRFPASPVLSGSTQMESDVTANSVNLHATLTSNGYGGEYWFRYGLSSDPLNDVSSESVHVRFDGFVGTLPVDFTLLGLKGHRTYHYLLSATSGVGSDTSTAVSAPVASFTTPNGAPAAQDDSILVSEVGVGVAGSVLLNDIDPDDDPVTIDSFTQGAQGSVQQVGDTLVYTPGAGFTGDDQFTYTIKDDQVPPLTATATVHVLSNGAIAGEYAGLLIEQPAPSVNIPRGAAALTADQIAAGFAAFALSRNRGFSGRFEISGRPVAIHGTMAEGRDTHVETQIPGSGDRFAVDFRAISSAAEGRVTLNGRTLIFRLGQAFAAGAAPVQLPKSDFTMRLTPDTQADPVNGPGLPAGSGFAVIRRLANARGQFVGVLPDGTPFSKQSIIDKTGSMPVLAKIYKDKQGSIEATLVIDQNGSKAVDGDPQRPARWQKTRQKKDTRFTNGFATTLTIFGGKYTVPSSKVPLFDPAVPVLEATFDRGGLFEAVATRFSISGSKFTADPAHDDAKAKAVVNARTGLLTGTFKPGKTAIAYRGVVVQRDQSCTGFFLGRADAGSVSFAVPF